MKYSTEELLILKQGGKQALKDFHAAKRKCSSTRANCTIESKKYRKEKYKANYEDQSYIFLYVSFLSRLVK